MKRRTFIKGAAVGYAATAASPLAAPAIAQGRIQWKMVTCWPRNMPAIGVGAQRLCDRIGEMSGGRLTIKLYAAGELVPAFEVFDAVREGIAEAGHDAPYYWIAKHSAIPFFCSVPAGLTPQEHCAWITSGGGQALWDELNADFGVRAFLAGSGCPNMGGWFRREINSPADLDGLRMRIPGLGAEVFSRLGVITVNMPGSEVLPALQSGAIDATEWAGPYIDLALGLYKVAPYYYGPGIHEPGPAISLLVNNEAYEELPNDLKAMVQAAAAEDNGRMIFETTAFNATALQTLIEKHDVDVRHFPDEVISLMLSNAEDVLRETAAKTEIGQRVFESWNAFRGRMIGNAAYSEMGYLNRRAAG